MKITRRVKEINQEDYFKLFNEFINDTAKGYRMRVNGRSIRRSTINNYETARNLLMEFTAVTGFEIRLYLVNNLSQQENEQARRYSHRFYMALSDFLYSKGCFDNYVGLIFTLIKAFYNYLINERNINVGPFHKKFYVHKEHIPIVVLSPDQLNFLIYNKEFDQQLKPNLRIIKDIFVFGCTVALRACDLLNLREYNLKIENNIYYLIVTSQKTNTPTQIKLPDHAVEILKKYQGLYSTLLPRVEMTKFNRELKQLARLITDNQPLIKIRTRKGQPETIYKDPVNRTHYLLADHFTTHTMRRTAITTMLRFGMSELNVRKISGHAATKRVLSIR